MLRLKQLGIDTCHETVAFLARCCPFYRAQEFLALARIEISAAGRRIVATLNIVDDESIRAHGQRETGMESGPTLFPHAHPRHASSCSLPGAIESTQVDLPAANAT